MSSLLAISIHAKLLTASQRSGVNNLIRQLDDFFLLNVHNHQLRVVIYSYKITRLPLISASRFPATSPTVTGNIESGFSLAA